MSAGSNSPQAERMRGMVRGLWAAFTAGQPLKNTGSDALDVWLCGALGRPAALYDLDEAALQAVIERLLRRVEMVTGRLATDGRAWTRVSASRGSPS
jgi:hypothetical protein